MVITRGNQLKVMISDDEQRMIRELADREQVSASDLVRKLVRDAHASAESQAAQMIEAVKDGRLAPGTLELLKHGSDPIAARVAKAAEKSAIGKPKRAR